MDLLVKPARVKHGKLASLLEPPKDADVRPAATKVVATIGSATRSEKVLDEMFEAGMTAARFDVSFGDLSYHCQSLELVHNAATKANRLCSMILDLGDKECQVVQPSRVDENGWHQCTQRIRIKRGQHVTLTASGDMNIPEDAEGEVVLPVSQPQLLDRMSPGDEISMCRYLSIDQDDRKVTLTVVAATSSGVSCEARDSIDVLGHLIVAHIPRSPSATSMHTSEGCTLLLEDNIAAIDAFHSRGMLDFLVIGEIRSPEDVMAVRQYLFSIGASETKLLLKVKNAAMVDNFTVLSGLIDGIVLSRGWLGLHMPPELMAPLQKRLLRYCNINGKLALVTRIVDSMQDAPRPTRAEATDIANSVLDGADGFVLGSQTTRGSHPVTAVATVHGICREAERAFDYSSHLERIMNIMAHQTPDAGSFTKSQDQSKVTALPALGNVNEAFGTAASQPGIAGGAAIPVPPFPSFAPVHTDATIRRQSLSDLNDRPSRLANVMSTDCLSTAPSLDARDESASSKDGVAPATARGEAADGKTGTGRGRSPEGAGSVEGGGEEPAGRHARGVSIASSQGRPPSPPGANGTTARPNACGSQGLKSIKRGMLAAKLSRSNNAFNAAPGRPFHPVASWGTLSMMGQSLASTPQASFTNLSGLDEAATAAGRPPSPPMRSLTPPRGHRSFTRGVSGVGKPGLHIPSEASGALMTSAQVTAAAAVNLATSSDAHLIVVVTDSGHTSAAVAKFRPRMPVISLVVPRVVKQGLAWSVKGNVIARQCNLLHGVTSVLASANAHPKGILAHGFQHAVSAGLAGKDDLAVVIMNVGGRFSATTVQQVKIGDVLSPPREEFAGVLA